MCNQLAVWCVALATWGVTLVGLTSTTSTHPSIVWNPWNPMFACDEPKINVRIGDIVNFVCPSDELTFYVPSTSITLVYENLYFLGTRRDLYNACDATGMTQLLRCNGDQPKHTTVTFRDFAMNKRSITFERGKTYYFIGTGFRTKENLDGRTNGSCKLTDEQGKYRLRLQVHVCADDDAGCHICKTTACYYKNCGRITCSSWFSIGPNYQNITNCFQIQTRTCKNDLTEHEWHETTHANVLCSYSNNTSANCTQWSSTGNLYYDTNAMQCYAVETRGCNNLSTSDKISYSENRYKGVPCPQVLRLCSNVTSTFLLRGECNPSGSQYCRLVLGGAIPSRTYTPCRLSSKVQPVQPTKSVTGSLGTSSHYGPVSFIDVMSESSIYASPSVVSVTSSRGCTGSALVPDTFIDNEMEYQRSYGDGKDSSLKDRLILGLAVSVAIAFIIGVMLGSFTVKYLENRHRSAKVQDKEIVVPGTVATFTNTGYDDTQGSFDNLGSEV